MQVKTVKQLKNTHSKLISIVFNEGLTQNYFFGIYVDLNLLFFNFSLNFDYFFKGYLSYLFQFEIGQVNFFCLKYQFLIECLCRHLILTEILFSVPDGPILFSLLN